MTYKEIATMIGAMKLPFAYDHFPDKEAPAPPFIFFYFSGSSDLSADNTNYQRIRPLVLELYSDNKDFDLEEAVETALNAAGLVYSRVETYIDTERLYMVTFTSDIIITEELNNA